MNFPKDDASRAARRAAGQATPKAQTLTQDGALAADPSAHAAASEVNAGASAAPQNGPLTIPKPRPKGVTLEMELAAKKTIAEPAAAPVQRTVVVPSQRTVIVPATAAAAHPAPASGSTPEAPVAVASEPVVPEPVVEWKDLGLSAEALELIEKSGFKRPTPIQTKAIPLALEGRDLIASSQTGTGKTAAFVLPMVEKLAGRKGPYGLILAPTREIAQQIQTTLQLFAEPRGLRSAVLIGGIDMRYDAQALANYPEIIVATPGRLCDHIERGNVWLEYIEFLILDEADRMLDMGFSEQLNKIVAATPDTRQTLLFSATFAGPVEKLAKKILKDPERLAMGRISAAKTVTQRMIFLRGEEEKNRELRAQLRQEKGSVIVFTRTKDGATRVFRMLHSASFYDVTYIHSDRLQSHREQALAEFRSGKYRILIATDVAGRGIHVDEVAHVINYDLPLEPEDYIHRVGRTGRAESTGMATSFATHRDRDLLKAIERLLKGPIPEIPSIISGRTQVEASSQEPASSEAVREPRSDRGPRPSRGNGKSSPRPSSPVAANGSLRPSQRPGPIRAIDLLPPAEFYEGEADLGWAPGGAPADETASDLNDAGAGDSAGDSLEENFSGGSSGRGQDSDPSRRRRRRRRGGGGRGPRGPKPPTGSSTGPRTPSGD
jgi:ATP-dependent RNA helicase RhlE